MIRNHVADECCKSPTKTLRSCCKVCKECPNCYDVSYDRVRDVIYSIEDKISKDSEEIICYKRWGFSKPIMHSSDRNLLLLYRDVLQRYNVQLIKEGKSNCLCTDEVQNMIENALNVTNINCINDSKRCDIITDDSNLDSWLITNPGCVSFEDWEARMYWVMPKLGFTITNVTDAYKLLYALSVDRIRDYNQILYTLTVISKAKNENCYDVNVNIEKANCNLGYSAFIKDVAVCKLEFNALIEEIKCDTTLSASVKNVVCDINFETYAKLLECNLSVSAISNLMKCGLGLSYNVDKKCAELQVGSSSILLDEGFDVDILGEEVDLSLLEGYPRGTCKIDTPIDLIREGYTF